jgi:hypothetical protein
MNFKKLLQDIKKDKEKMFYAIAAVVFLCAIILLLYFIFRGRSTETGGVMDDTMGTATSTQNQRVECEFQSGLTGECVPSESEEFQPLVGVMIENFTSARPQDGIAQASVVYEAPAEGNITRFLALFPLDSDVEKAGPVRSARPYYLDFVSEYPGAVYMHVGGSPEALQKIDQYNIFDVDEFYRGIYFWRDENKSAPHNAFTSSDLWKDVYERYADKNVDAKFESWNFSASSTRECAANCVSDVQIPFLRPSYVVKWKYNSELKVFERFHSNTVHVDSNGNPVKASTVIVQHVTDKILDDVGRRALGTIGEGKVEVYVYGERFEGVWKKDSRTFRTKFLDGSGIEIPLAPGKIWIEIVPENIQVTSTPR